MKICEMKKFWKTAIAVVMTAGFVFPVCTPGYANGGLQTEKSDVNVELQTEETGADGVLQTEETGADEVLQEEKAQLASTLYAKSAVLMDADTGRVLFEKSGGQQMPNASTTKILTCLVALEHASLEDTVTFSSNAASQPRVRLGAPEGSTFYMKDMLLAMMLESFNDTAVAIAETIAGSTEEFAVMMNRKAKEIGCKNTHFVTPNGLDDTDENGSHSTTAEDLALIMAACIKNEQFLEITRTNQHSFTSCDGTLQYAVSNKNAFLTMMDGVLSGKTGFTGAAGYCYVCAFSKDGKNFTLSLLACGWPNNKTYKWKDARKLIEYGMEHYEFRTETLNTPMPDITVWDGCLESEYPTEKVTLNLPPETKEFSCLLNQDEHITVQTDLKEEFQAPVDETTYIGTVRYYLGDKLLAEEEVIMPSVVEKRTMKISLQWVWKTYCQPFASLV